MKEKISTKSVDVKPRSFSSTSNNTQYSRLEKFNILHNTGTKTPILTILGLTLLSTLGFGAKLRRNK